MKVLKPQQGKSGRTGSSREELFCNDHTPLIPPALPAVGGKESVGKSEVELGKRGNRSVTLMFFFSVLEYRF